MPGKETQHQSPLKSPLVLQLLKNREVQLAADAKKNPEGGDYGVQFFARQPTERDFGSMMEWVAVFFQVFWLALFSGIFLLLWIFALKLVGY
jgi:hypothetical protein